MHTLRSLAVSFAHITNHDQLNAIDLEGIIKVVAGSCRSMGVEVVD